MAWLAWQREVPVLLLVGQTPETYARAYQLGVSVCLPREQALAHPPMLAGGLDQAMNICEMRFGYQRIKEQLAQSRRHTDSLVNMLWRATPRSNDNHWFPQRYMLERLCEELARTERHAVPLTMVIGELRPSAEGNSLGLPDWVTNAIVKSKRRCDVAGQYGTNGFLMLLVHTSKQGGINCCRRLKQMIEHPPQTAQAPHRRTCSRFSASSAPAPARTRPRHCSAVPSKRWNSPGPIQASRSPPTDGGSPRQACCPYHVRMNASTSKPRCLRAGMVGLGMIFDETYRPFFEQMHAGGLYRRDFGLVDVELAAVASRTGQPGGPLSSSPRLPDFACFAEPDAMPKLLASGVDAVCVATPDDRHFAAARLALEAGKHVLIEKPSVLSLQELDVLQDLARQKGVLAKVVYHKLADPDHKKLRTHVLDGNLRTTSTTATARCWSRSRSAAASSPSGSRAAIRAPTSPCITSS